MRLFSQATIPSATQACNHSYYNLTSFLKALVTWYTNSAYLLQLIEMFLSVAIMMLIKLILFACSYDVPDAKALVLYKKEWSKSSVTSVLPEDGKCR